MSKQQNLQAWDAADEYLIEHVLTNCPLNKDSNILIFNDSFGAVTLSLSEYNPDILTDSIVSKLGIIANANQNSINTFNVLTSLAELEKNYDYLLIKAPKTLDYLRYFLAKVRPHIHESTQIIVAGMIKSMPKTVWKILEDSLGATSTSLAKKKARLIFVKLEKNNTQTQFPTAFQQENTENAIYNHANVFSKQSLDIGTRFLLQNLPKFNDVKTIIDLGCGNGIVGLNLAHSYPQAKVIFTDESYMAVESAKLTAQNNLDTISKHEFVTNNCLDGFEDASADLIICNPPFHQSHAIGMHIALQMFQQSFKILTENGCFVVIANRHLPYYPHLKRIFGNVKTIANNNKFNIFQMKR